MPKKIFAAASVISDEDKIDSFTPPNPGWNYVVIEKNPEKGGRSFGRTGKWLLFVPSDEFIEAFRSLAILSKQSKLTKTFKASGRAQNGNHVFCIYVDSYENVSFLQEIAERLRKEGFIDRYGVLYKTGERAIFFKPDAATGYRSRAAGLNLSLYKYNNKGELFLKEFENMETPLWKLVTDFSERRIASNYEGYLEKLGSSVVDEEYFS